MFLGALSSFFFSQKKQECTSFILELDLVFFFSFHQLVVVVVVVVDIKILLKGQTRIKIGGVLSKVFNVEKTKRMSFK